MRPRRRVLLARLDVYAATVAELRERLRIAHEKNRALAGLYGRCECGICDQSSPDPGSRP